MGNKSYNGYSSCPLITGYGKIVLAKFDYDKNFISNTMLKQLFIKDSSKSTGACGCLKKRASISVLIKMLMGIDV
jgi:sulfide:quinone oxidoreductase|tara:strand:- start:182267 stop:182491 length:225 start_codon:yes stop_codon:yes gene_type:complete